VTSRIFVDFHNCRSSHEDEIIFGEQGLIRFLKTVKNVDWTTWSTIHRSLEIQTFHLTSNDSTLKIENTIFLKPKKSQTLHGGRKFK
jgi:hypothetical protein